MMLILEVPGGFVLEVIMPNKVYKYDFNTFEGAVSYAEYLASGVLN